MKKTLRIALVGVPGNGKTRLAQSIHEVYSGYKFAIIDGYAEKFSQRSDVALGEAATWLANAQVAFIREQEELAKVKRNRNYIVCGSMLDSLARSGVIAHVAMQQPSSRINDTISQRSILTTQFLMMMTTAVSRHNLYVYLALGDMADTVDPSLKLLDDALSSAIDRLAMPVHRVEAWKGDSEIDSIVFRAIDSIE